MSDLEEILAAIRQFRDERHWMQFHNPKDMAAAISIEAAELQEIFLWQPSSASIQLAEVDKARVREEIADIAIYLLELSDNLKIDLLEVIKSKLEKNAKKYPAEKARGSSQKYTEYLRKLDSPT